MALTVQQDAQRMEALEIANRKRVAKKDVKVTLKELRQVDGLRLAAAILRDPHPDIDAFRLEELLRSVQSMGIRKARRLCVSVQVPGDRRLRQLTVGQRERVAEALDFKVFEIGKRWRPAA